MGALVVAQQRVSAKTIPSIHDAANQVVTQVHFIRKELKAHHECDQAKDRELLRLVKELERPPH